MIEIIDLQFLGVEKAIAAFLIKTSDGPVLIESGPYSTFPVLKNGIEKAGFKLEDIKHVFLSHIHFDHAGAAWALAERGAKVYVHPVGAPHMVDPSKLVNSAKRIYQDQMDMLWGKLNPINPDQIILAEHNQKFKIGESTFISHHTPGHAIHHIAWQFGEVLFTGDVAGVSISNGIVVPPCPPPDINLEAWNGSINLMRRLNLKALYLTHFGKIVHIDNHLNKLEICLNDWAEWLRPYAFENNLDLEKTTTAFQSYVAKQLRDKGISESCIKQYETANPSWMSVAGLIRYWKKKQKA